MKQSIDHRQQTGRRFFRILGVGLITAAAFVLVVLLAQTRSASVAPHFVQVSPGNAGAEALRTVVVARQGELLPRMSEANSFLMTSMVAGDLPAAATQGVIMSDSNCQPDQDGISHCLNTMRVGTKTVTIRHHHDMRMVPCLTPGETVTLLSADQYRDL